jgi:hypothetical protein
MPSEEDDKYDLQPAICTVWTSGTLVMVTSDSLTPVITVPQSPLFRVYRNGKRH